MKKLSIIIALVSIICSCAPKGESIPAEIKQYYKDSLEVLTARCQDVLDAAAKYNFKSQKETETE